MRPSLRVFVLIGLLTSCVESERVHVGELGKTLDLSECFGSRTRCELDRPWPTILDSRQGASESECELVHDDSWYVGWWRDLTRERCAPLGYCSAVEVAFAGDGTVWTASLGETPVEASEDTLRGLFLAHYDSDGELLATSVVETVRMLGGAAHEVAIAADDRGHVFVAMLWLGGPAWLAEYDALARPVGKRVPLAGLVEGADVALSAGVDGSVLVTASDYDGRSSVLARLDSGLTPRFIQNRALPGTRAQPLPSWSGNAAILAENLISPGSASAQAISSYDSAGNLVTQLGLSLDQQPIAIDRDGNVLLFTTWSERQLTPIKLTPDGELLFKVPLGDHRDRLASDSGQLLFGATADEEGNSYFATSLRQDSERNDVVMLWQLSADGERCTRSRIVNAVAGPRQNFLHLTEFQALFRTKDGALYFRTDSEIGRLMQ